MHEILGWKKGQLTKPQVWQAHTSDKNPFDWLLPVLRLVDCWVRKSSYFSAGRRSILLRVSRNAVRGGAYCCGHHAGDVPANSSHNFWVRCVVWGVHLCPIDFPVGATVGYVWEGIHAFVCFKNKHSAACPWGASQCTLKSVFTGRCACDLSVCYVHSSCVWTWPMSGWGCTSLRCYSSRSRLSVCRRASPWRPHAPPATSQPFWTSFFRYCMFLVWTGPGQFGLSQYNLTFWFHPELRQKFKNHMGNFNRRNSITLKKGPN